MQKILSGTDIKRLDKEFADLEGISSLDLMERAATVFVDWFLDRFPGKGWCVDVVCGTGNNGGDGLAIARMLSERGYNLKVFLLGDAASGSLDFRANLARLPDSVSFEAINHVNDLVLVGELVLDAIFGVGINRPLDGVYRDVVDKINHSGVPVISIDLPSGLPSDTLLTGDAVRASVTVSFQFPKVSLLLPEHGDYIGELVVVSIGMDSFDYASFLSDLYYVVRRDIKPLHKIFNRFSHKGTFGRVLIVGGTLGKIGAVALGCRAALRCGSGLVSAFLPTCGLIPIQSAVLEAMVECSLGLEVLSLPLPDLSRYSAIAIGPGLGTSAEALQVFREILLTYDGQVVVDADAINLLGANTDLLDFLEGTVITPHLVEFERLVGVCGNHLERMTRARDFAVDFKCVVVLKGANTLISLPDGRQLVNSTGTKHMATGGAGDVLTGMICSFLGQGYSQEDAAICAVFHHGLAGEIAAESKGRGTIASDIVDSIPQTFIRLDIS